MSISTANRTIALKALAAFESAFESAKFEKKEKIKDYINAVQKAMLLLGTQGLKRMVLYISSQMGKDDDKSENEQKAWRHLYNQLADFSGTGREAFQYKIVFELTKEQAALREEDIAFFLLCLKRLANAKWAEIETSSQKDLNTEEKDPEIDSTHA